MTGPDMISSVTVVRRNRAVPDLPTALDPSRYRPHHRDRNLHPRRLGIRVSLNLQTASVPTPAPTASPDDVVRAYTNAYNQRGFHTMTALTRRDRKPWL